MYIVEIMSHGVRVGIYGPFHSQEAALDWMAAGEWGDNATVHDLQLPQVEATT